MDFVVTKSFLRMIGVSGNHIELYKLLDMFIDKKCSYIVKHYKILENNSTHFFVTLIKLLKHIYDTNNNLCVDLSNRDDLSYTGLHSIRRIIFDENYNVLKIYDINGTLILDNYYVDNKIITSTFIDRTRGIKTMYEYDDFGVLYCKKTLYTIKNRVFSSSRIDLYDVNGIIKNSVTTLESADKNIITIRKTYKKHYENNKLIYYKTEEHSSGLFTHTIGYNIYSEEDDCICCSILDLENIFHDGDEIIAIDIVKLRNTFDMTFDDDIAIICKYEGFNKFDTPINNKSVLDGKNNYVKELYLEYYPHMAFKFDENATLRGIYNDNEIQIIKII